ncbi:carotenoid ester lipase-like protein precursor [Corynespora cassiicola Philippines]|uniref:Carboxylic ester hydrolase n=1 Tax=Corynespora cassiicola Philippines TaxID=1448308 RepID=A0A2T2N843_CORCC|nr:carotenoid ester lipase-like protein precursor [Corynespora cassiicola Philippines]
MRSLIGGIQFFSTLGQPTATVKNGTLIGVRNSHYNQDFFLGIPYAQPPVGKLRLDRPQPLNETWNERPAKAYGPWCHSISLGLPGFNENGFTHEESEDCLSLNVVRPSSAGDYNRLPVLVWIYGGGFAEGGSADQRYNLSFLVEESVGMGKPIVGVSFNYRLGGFGFLSGSAIRKSRASNLGLQDQRLALRWIQENIAAFGGDPSRVTINGESAGAFSLGSLYTAYGGQDDGLFHAGIAQSGGAIFPVPNTLLEEQDVGYYRILNRVGCLNSTDSLECLRSKDAETLNAAFVGGTFSPTVDDELVVPYSSEAVSNGRFVKRPLLIGTCRNEGTSFTVQEGWAVNNTADFRAYLSMAWPDIPNGTVDIWMDEYVNKLRSDALREELGTVLQSPGPEHGAIFGNVALYRGDITFDAPRRLAAKMWGKYGVPLYSYRFNVAPSDMDPEVFGVAHFQDVPFTFRNYDGVGFENNKMASNSTKIQREYQQVSKLMSRMWISFVNDYSPNGHNVRGFDVIWPTYKNGSAVNMLFGLNETRLEEDTYRSSAIGSIIGSFRDIGV